MFFRDRTTEWIEPRMPAGLAAALLIAVVGVFYFGIFSDNVIRKFSQPNAEISTTASR
jgi:hypothetical protein